MTIRGILCLLADGVLLTVALGSGIRSLHVGAALLTFFLLFSLVSLLLAAATLRVEGDIQPDCLQRGETVRYRFAMEGFVLLPVVGHMQILPPGINRRQNKQRKCHAFFLYPSWRRWQRAFQVEFTCPHRGYWPMQPERLRLQDIFGLFSLPLLRHGEIQPRPVSLRVLPRVHQLEAGYDSRTVADGFATALIRNASNGELFGETRQYQEGDPVKRIHWKQSARTGQLHVRQYEAQENPQAMLVMDLGCHTRDVVKLADIATETVATIAGHILRYRKTVQVLFVRGANGGQSNDTLWLQDEHDLNTLLDSLAGAVFYTETAPLEPWQLRDMRYMNAGAVYVVSEAPSEALLESLLRLKKVGRKVGCMVPCAELPTETVAQALREGELKPVILRDADEIPEKVGACL